MSVPAPTDDVYVDAGSVSATIASATGGNFESLAINPAAATTAITDTLDVTTVSLTASASVAEGGSILYTASLNNPAGTATTVTLSNGATISIAAGASSGSVSVPAPSDDVYLDAGSVSATISSASGGNFEIPGDQPGCCNHVDHRYARHHHGLDQRRQQRGRRRKCKLHRIAHQSGAIRGHGQSQLQRYGNQRFRLHRCGQRDHPGRILQCQLQPRDD